MPYISRTHAGRRRHRCDRATAHSGSLQTSSSSWSARPLSWVAIRALTRVRLLLRGLVDGADHGRMNRAVILAARGADRLRLARCAWREITRVHGSIVQ